ncbi:MAG: prolipoprotein diacylglyceryl transferase [Clostridia bacterium]|nr:prolipoprotein diacylglyceryl transferase [Clostridia bacterium]
MDRINFEGLGISLDINRVAFEFEGIKIYWYAIIIVSGIILSLFLCHKDNGKYNIKFEDVLELALFIFPVSIIFARLYFVLFKLDYYLQNPMEIFNIRNGGLAIYGGIIGAIVTILVYCKIKKIKFWDMVDYIVPYLPLGQSIGRWGNFFNQEAHGTETDSLFRMGIVENGNYIQVHPTFLYESICTFIIFLILYFNRNKRKYPGEITYTYLFLYGIARSIIEGFRTDSLMLGEFRISQILSIILSIIFGSIIIYKKVRK